MVAHSLAVLGKASFEARNAGRTEYGKAFKILHQPCLVTILTRHLLSSQITEPSPLVPLLTFGLPFDKSQLFATIPSRIHNLNGVVKLAGPSPVAVGRYGDVWAAHRGRDLVCPTSPTVDLRLLIIKFQIAVKVVQTIVPLQTPEDEIADMRKVRVASLFNTTQSLTLLLLFGTTRALSTDFFCGTVLIIEVCWVLMAMFRRAIPSVLLPPGAQMEKLKTT